MPRRLTHEIASLTGRDPLQRTPLSRLDSATDRETYRQLSKTAAGTNYKW